MHPTPSTTTPKSFFQKTSKTTRGERILVFATTGLNRMSEDDFRTPLQELNADHGLHKSEAAVGRGALNLWTWTTRGRR